MNYAPSIIYGLIGYPVKHSFSPAMHNAAFKYLKHSGQLNCDAEYRLFEICPGKLKQFLLPDSDQEFKDTNNNSVRAADVIGFNITIPHKLRAVEILGGSPFLIKNIPTEQDHYVFISGAINTVKRDNNFCNTDAPGFVRSLKEDLKFNTQGKNILIFGCGGAGRAVIAGLTWEDSGIKKIYIYDVSKEATESAQKHFSRLDFLNLKEKLEFISEKQIPEKIKKCSLLVNASAVGMKQGDGSVIDRKLLHEDLFIYDVVYNRKTQLIKDAKSLLLPAADGLGMLLYQGVLAFEFWTGKDAPVEVMRLALQGELEKCRR